MRTTIYSVSSELDISQGTPLDAYHIVLNIERRLLPPTFSSLTLITMLNTIIKRDGSTEKFDAEKLLNSLKFIVKSLKIKDNPISQKVCAPTIARLEKMHPASDTVTSEEVRNAISAVLAENNLT